MCERVLTFAASASIESELVTSSDGSSNSSRGRQSSDSNNLTKYAQRTWIQVQQDLDSRSLAPAFCVNVESSSLSAFQQKSSSGRVYGNLTALTESENHILRTLIAASANLIWLSHSLSDINIKLVCNGFASRCHHLTTIIHPFTTAILTTTASPNFVVHKISDCYECVNVKHCPPTHTQTLMLCENSHLTSN